MSPSHASLIQLAWTQFWQVTLVIAVVGVASRFLDRRSHLVYLLWLVVLVKCLTPPLWSSPTGVFSWALASAEATTPAEMVQQEIAAFDVDAESATGGSRPTTAGNHSDEPAVTESRGGRPRSVERAGSAPASVRIEPTMLLLAVWLCGALLYAGWVLRTMMVWQRLVRTAGTAVPANISVLADSLAERLRLRRPVRLVQLNAPLGPLTYGCLHPTVALPKALLDANLAQQFEPLLAHELTHVRRHDTLVGMVQVFVQGLWWFHPLVWWANGQISRVRERCCDEEVVAALGCSAAQYVRSLLHVLEHQRRPSLPLLAGVRSFEVTKQRIEHLVRVAGSPHAKTPRPYWAVAAAIGLLLVPGAALTPSASQALAQGGGANAPAGNGLLDWTQWGGSGLRNNTPAGTNIPSEWKVGGANMKWIARLGSQCYTTPVVADGQVFMGTNNGAGYLPRYPAQIDLGVLLCLRESDGAFLWQHSNEKLASGRVHDWPQQGVCATPLVEGKRLWYVSNRGEVVCLDTQGFNDRKDDGPVTREPARIFNLLQDLDPARDVVAGVVKRLRTGKDSDALADLFRAAGLELPPSAVFTTATLDDLKSAHLRFGDEALPPEENFKLSFTPENGALREVFVQIEGRRLIGYKLLNIDDKDEADVIWRFDMMAELHTRQHNMSNCSVTAAGDILFVNTSNGVDESHANLPAPRAPSFIALNKTTGKLLWTDNSPGENILDGQWSSPAYAVLGGVPQVIFGGGDGWVYSFRGDAASPERKELLWQFDCNPKEAKYALKGPVERNHIVGTPVVYEGLVYVGVGADPEHGEGRGHLWCIDPTKRGDVSPQLAFTAADQQEPVPRRRVQAVDPAKGEVAVANPNSAAVWHFASHDTNHNGAIDIDETMHRTCGTVAIANDLLYVADFAGIFHCIDARTGVPHWSHDLLAEVWGSPLIVEGKVYIGDADGTVSVFMLDKNKKLLAQNSLPNAVYSTPVVANNTLFIADQKNLFAIEAKRQP